MKIMRTKYIWYKKKKYLSEREKERERKQYSDQVDTTETHYFTHRNAANNFILLCLRSPPANLQFVHFTGFAAVQMLLHAFNINSVALCACIVLFVSLFFC